MAHRSGRLSPAGFVRGRHLTMSVLTLLALAAASAVAAVVGWRYGVDHTPIDAGCNCGPDVATFGVVVLSGLLGSLTGILLVAAVFGAVGLVLFLRHRRQAPRTDVPPTDVPDPDAQGLDPVDAGMEQWWPGARE